MRRHLWPALIALLAQAAAATDGVIEINHARALAGNVTPGDTAGYPVTISLSGSYRLTSNLTPDAVTNGIYVTADDVTIDLNGFTIRGPVTCSGSPVTACTGTGIGNGVVSYNKGVTVRNGTVVGAGHWGVALLGDYGSVSGVVARGNGESGIRVVNGGTVTGSRAVENGLYGIFVGSACVLAGNVARGNYWYGVYVTGAGVTISGNNVGTNGNVGIQIDATAGGSTVLGNTVFGNVSYGLRCDSSGGSDGYAQNVFRANNGAGAQVLGCTSLGTGSNVCNGVSCP